MSELSTKQILNIRAIQIYTIYNNCGLFMTEYNSRFCNKVSKFGECQYKNKI